MAAEKKDLTLADIALAELDEDLKATVNSQIVAFENMIIALQVQQVRYARTAAYYAEELCRKT